MTEDVVLHKERNTKCSSAAELYLSAFGCLFGKVKHDRRGNRNPSLQEAKRYTKGCNGLGYIISVAVVEFHRVNAGSEGNLNF